MRRRDFITGIVGLAAWPRAARAQKSKPTARIGVIMGIGENDPEAGPRVEALEAGLRELGWVKGRNLRLEYRWTAGDPDRTQRFAKEIVELKPDLIVVHSTPAVKAIAPADDVHTNGLCPDSRPNRKRIRSEPLASRRQHYWIHER